MARTGRPPTPIEIKRRRGTIRKDRLPAVATVSVLPMAAGIPDPCADLGLEGRALWARLWAQAITWLSPDSDWTAAVDACRVVDDLAIARDRYAATHDPVDARAVAIMRKGLAEALSALGFTPTARARLGLAEVKKADAIEQILSRRRSTKA